MRPVEIYKRLPKSNCKKCGVASCMAFAMRLHRNEATPDECPEIDEKTKEELRSALYTPGDWMHQRFHELQDELRGIDLKSLSPRMGGRLWEDGIVIRYMGRDVRINTSLIPDTPDIWDRLLILMYLKKAGDVPLKGEWVAFRDLKDGMIRAEAFHETCEIALARMFDELGERLLGYLKKMGARETKGFSADHSVIINPLPKIPFLILLWRPDEDFSAECRVLLDSTVTQFLDVEALLYLGMAFIRNLREVIKHRNT